MEKERELLENIEEEDILIPPYTSLLYLDSLNQKHLAMIKDKNYLKYLKDNYIVLEEKFVEKF